MRNSFSDWIESIVIEMMLGVRSTISQQQLDFLLLFI